LLGREQVHDNANDKKGGDNYTEINVEINVEYIQKTAGDFYKIKVADMYSKKRPASIARPRQIAMYLAKEMTQNCG